MGEAQKKEPKSLSALKKLKEQNKELERFVYSASHDLKAPLRSILGIVNIAKTETTDVSMAKYLEMIGRSAGKLDNFINDLVNFSRNSRLEVKPEEVNFESLVAETRENLSHLDHAEEMDITLRAEIFHFKSDVARLKVIFANMISNAIKYRKHDPGVRSKLDIFVREVGNGVELVFADNGEGIQPQFIDKIYEMFYRASENSHGSGLGLYIVHEVVQKLKGKITVTSTIDVGTTFTIKLPSLKTKKS